MAEGVLDKVLDRTVVVGYTSLGYRLRRARWPRDDPRPGVMIGRRALVTGAASGLGRAAARELVRLGATVHALGRSSERIDPVTEELRAAAEAQGWPGRVRAEVCDVADLTDVRRFAEALTGRLGERGESLDVLVHNAGVLPPERAITPDGHELSFATHVLGPTLMTELLLPVLATSDAGARVVLVSSGGMYGQKAPVDDVEFRSGRYRGTTAYARSKRIQVDLTPTLADRWSEAGITISAMHPGWADTPGVASSLPLFRTVTRPLLRDATAGADTVVWLAATDPAPPTGLFWHDRVPRPTSYLARTRSDPHEVAALWASVQAALPELRPEGRRPR